MGAWKLSTACLASRLRQSREDAPGRPSKTFLDIDRYCPKTGRFELPVKRVPGNPHSPALLSTAPTISIERLRNRVACT